MRRRSAIAAAAAAVVVFFILWSRGSASKPDAARTGPDARIARWPAGSTPGPAQLVAPPSGREDAVHERRPSPQALIGIALSRFAEEARPQLENCYRAIGPRQRVALVDLTLRRVGELEGRTRFVTESLQPPLADEPGSARIGACLALLAGRPVFLPSELPEASHERITRAVPMLVADLAPLPDRP